MGAAVDAFLAPAAPKPARWKTFWQITIADAKNDEDFALPGHLPEHQVTALLRLLVASTLTRREIIDSFSSNQPCWSQKLFEVREHGDWPLVCGSGETRVYAAKFEIPGLLH